MVPPVHNTVKGNRTYLIRSIVSVCVVDTVIDKTYFNVKANIDCDICYFDVVVRISELVVIKCTLWQGGLEGVLEDVPKGVPARDFRRQLQISRYGIYLNNYRYSNIFKTRRSHPRLFKSKRVQHIKR